MRSGNRKYTPMQQSCYHKYKSSQQPTSQPSCEKDHPNAHIHISPVGRSTYVGKKNSNSKIGSNTTRWCAIGRWDGAYPVTWSRASSRVTHTQPGDFFTRRKYFPTPYGWHLRFRLQLSSAILFCGIPHSALSSSSVVFVPVVIVARDVLTGSPSGFSFCRICWFF